MDVAVTVWECEECRNVFRSTASRPGQCMVCGNRTKVPREVPDPPPQLFVTDPPVPREVESADRSRTRRRKALLDRGVHPATSMPLLEPRGPTCGDCAHSYKSWGGARAYWKCDLVPPTGGPGTDIRISWPACTKYEENDDE